jgi:hypothetical protein
MQDFVLSQFFDGKIVDSVFSGPTGINQGKHQYGMWLKKMRQEATLLINNCTFTGIGLMEANSASFTSLKILNNTVSKIEKIVNAVNCTIYNTYINSSTISSIDELELSLQNINIADSTFQVKNDVSFTVDDDITISDSKITSTNCSIYLKQAAKLNTSVTTFTQSNSFSVTSKRSTSLTDNPAEVVSLEKTKFTGASFSISNIKKLICDTVSLESIKTISLSKLTAIFTEFNVDFNKAVSNITFDTCEFSASEIVFSNTISRHTVVFKSCTGKLSYSYATDNITNSTIDLESSTLLLIATENVYTGAITINLVSNNSLNSAVYSTSSIISISPNLLCIDKSVFAKGASTSSRSTTQVLYGVIIS